MKKLILALILATAIMAQADEATEIKTFLAANGITATSGSLDRAEKLILTRPVSSTTTNTIVARDATTVYMETQVKTLVDQVMGTNMPLPFTKEVTLQAYGRLDYMQEAATNFVDYKAVNKVIATLQFLKAELGGDLTYDLFSQPTKLVPVTTTTKGDSVAMKNGWATVQATNNVKSYLRGLYR
jgi:hypothetical protein